MCQLPSMTKQDFEEISKSRKAQAKKPCAETLEFLVLERAVPELNATSNRT
jgi:hypothetical protein